MIAHWYVNITKKVFRYSAQNTFMFVYVARVYTLCSNSIASVAEDWLGVYFYSKY